MPNSTAPVPTRRAVLGGAAALALPAVAAAEAVTMNIAVIGDARSGTWASVRAGGGGIDADRATGATLAWQPGFTASLPVMEAVRAGAIDFTFATSTALVNAIGAGIPIVPLAAFPLPATTVDGVALAESPIRAPADLRGKRVGYQNGTTGQYSLIKYLERGGLRLGDVQGVSVSGTDGFTALSRGELDAWFHWQPAATLGLERLGEKARRLPDVPTFDYAFYVARTRFAERNLEAAARLVRVLRDTQRFINANPAESVTLWASLGGFQADSLDARVFERLVREKRLSESTATELQPVGETAARETQEMADSFQALGVLPRRVDVTSFLLAGRFNDAGAAVARALAA